MKDPMEAMEASMEAWKLSHFHAVGVISTERLVEASREYNSTEASMKASTKVTSMESSM